MGGVFCMTNRPKSFSLTEKNVEFLEANEHLNNSALVNDLLDEYRQSKSITGIVDEIERRQLRRERDSLENQLESIADQLSSLETQANRADKRQTDAIESLAERLKDGRRLFPDHGAVKDVATDHFAGDTIRALETVKSYCDEKGIDYDADQLEGI